MRQEDKKQSILMIGLLSILHAFIDFLCAYSLYTNNTYTINAYIIYNFCAFVLQMPIGLIIDIITFKINNKIYPSLITIYLGSLFTIIGSFISPIIFGLGNALFHVGGGIITIKEDDYQKFKGKGLGIFVAPGAIGLFIGSILSKTNYYFLIKIISIILILLLCLMLYFVYHNLNKNINVENNNNDGNTLIIIILCFIVVFLRSLLGLAISYPWKINIIIAFISVIFLASGKALGGLIQSKIGIKKTIIISLLIATISYIFSNNLIFGLIAIISFNMTMPITLYLLEKKLKYYPGFSFGILTVALFIGYLPVVYRLIYNVSPIILGSIGSFISLIILLITYKIGHYDF